MPPLGGLADVGVKIGAHVASLPNCWRLSVRLDEECPRAVADTGQNECGLPVAT